MNIIIFLLLSGTTLSHRTSETEFNPFGQINYMADGEKSLNTMVGGKTIFGCGEGCLKCDSQIVVQI